MIAGLGNPGREYEGTPHNVGFVAVDALCRSLGGTWRIEPRFKADVAKVSHRGESLLLVKPMTYMNASGEAVGAIQHYFRMETPDVVVITDDVNLPPGRIRVRASGGAGGHNGLKSILTHTGTPHFTRVRIGVGRETHGDRVGHVLGRIADAHAPVIAEAAEKAAEAACCAACEGVDIAMNRYNAPPDPPEPAPEAPATPPHDDSQKPA